MKCKYYSACGTKDNCKACRISPEDKKFSVEHHMKIPLMSLGDCLEQVHKLEIYHMEKK